MSNYAIWGLIGPATWPGWLAALALVATFNTRWRRWVRRLLIASVATFLALTVLPLGDWLSRPLETRFVAPPDGAPAPAHILVLAGAEDLGGSAVAGRPEMNYAGDRLMEGAALAHRHPGALLWTVGGVRRYGHADVEVATRAWTRVGIPAGRIRQIDHTLDTCANARGVAAKRLQGRLLLVTTALHMPRAVACFQAAKVRVTPYPVDYSIRPSHMPGRVSLLSNLRQTDAALHEWIGLAYYRLSGRTATLLP